MDEKNQVGKLDYTLVEPRFGDDGCWSFVMGWMTFLFLIRLFILH
jgi:hypothetical protein